MHAGFRRHLARPFRFVVFTDRDRDFSGGIEQSRLTSATPGYGDCIEPYRLDSPMILVGLDTIVTGDVGHLADYCLTADRIALPLDPFKPSRVCNGVALVPAGIRHLRLPDVSYVPASDAAASLRLVRLSRLGEPQAIVANAITELEIVAAELV